MKMTFADILSRTETERERKVSGKIPEWACVDGLTFPSSLSLEQCSSSAAAVYKASVACRYGSDSIWDLTGGLGVDSWAFSKIFKAVHYNELNPELASAAGENFKSLRADNISVTCGDCRTLIPEIDGGVAYLDPARRDVAGRKVFLLEDCSPDVLRLLPSLLERCQAVMVKLSPMADISLLARKFEGHLREIHIVGLDGECKELLCVLSPEVSEDYRIVVKDLDSGDEFEYMSSEKGCLSIAGGDVSGYIIEPGAPLMKAGCFGLICSRFNVSQLDRNTHLFISGNICTCGLLRCYECIETFPFGKVGFRQIREKYSQADISARNVPLSSEELAARLKMKQGGGLHIFACTVAGSRLLIVTRKYGVVPDEIGAEG